MKKVILVLFVVLVASAIVYFEFIEEKPFWAEAKPDFMKSDSDKALDATRDSYNSTKKLVVDIVDGTKK